MAEITSTASNGRRPGVRRTKKLSPRVDLTPMVDLGFLLITFFMVSTSWSKPKAAVVRMPADGKPMELGASAALTLVALAGDSIFYYNGELQQSLKEGSFGITGYRQQGGIGDIIRQKQLALDRSCKGGRKEMMLMIKPAAASSYQDVVSLLDEALINDVKRYALIDLPSEELITIRSHTENPR